MARPEPKWTLSDAVHETLALLRPKRGRVVVVWTAALVLLPFGSRVTLLEVTLSLVLAAVLAALVSIDLDTFRLPDVLTLPLIATGVLLLPPYAWFDILERAVAACIGFAVIYGVAVGYRRWRGQAGIGLGDAKLFAAAGAWCTLVGLPSVLLVATLSALAVTLVVTCRQGTSISPATRIAFGPYLALGIWIVWLMGPLT